MNRSAIQLLILGLLLCGMAACTSVLVGGHATGSSDERPVSVVQADARITAAVKSALIRDAHVDSINITVQTYRGVVTLIGHTQTANELTRAITLARSIGGVRQVVSRLVVID